MTVTLRAEAISKEFNRRSVFRDLSFAISSGESLAVTGKNGAGKSTLLKILCGLLTPTGGRVIYERDGEPTTFETLRSAVGFVAPYLQLYDEFTALENLEVLSRIRSGQSLSSERVETLFRTFNLWHRRDDEVRTFSSGMKQRLKYIVALSHDPVLVFLDEPTANLDEEGADAVRTIASQLRKSGILILATNDDREAGWCEKRIHVGP